MKLRNMIVVIGIALFMFCGVAQAATQGQKIAFHEKRVETQKKIIHHAQRWQPIGHGWRVSVLLSRAEIIVAKDKLHKSVKILHNLYPLIGNKNAWLCIHRHEGSWTDPNPPYYGGLQMDLQFQRTYGSDYLRRFGTANNWVPYDQMIVAQRAYHSRGYYPWPNTARYCGLI